jgi:hypothetical protein
MGINDTLTTQDTEVPNEAQVFAFVDHSHRVAIFYWYIINSI